MTALRSRRVLVTAGLAVGLAAVGGSAIAEAASSPSTSPSSSSGTAAPSSGAGLTGGPGRGHGPRGGPRGRAAADGRITDVSSSALTVVDQFGTQHVFSLSSSTKIHEGLTTLTTSQLSRGEHVRVGAAPSSSSSSSSSSVAALDVDVLQPHLDGVVSSVAGSTITITDRDGFTRIITTSTSTTYNKAGRSVAASTINAGTPVHATGTVDSNGTTLDASSVTIATAPVAGTRPTPPAAGAAPPAASTPNTSSAPSSASSAAPSVTGS